MCCPAALEWGLCKASTWVTVLSKSTVCPVPSLLFSPFPSNRIDRCEAFALLIMWKKMIDQSTVSKSDLGLGLNSLHMVAASLPAGGRPVLAWNRRLPQWNRNSLRGTACYLRLSCCFLLLRVYRINYSYIIICNYSIYIYMVLTLILPQDPGFSGREMAALVASKVFYHLEEYAPHHLRHQAKTDG